MAVVATASDYAQALKERNKDLSGISEWEKYFLQPAQQAFESAVQTEQQKTAYDISGAYNAYKKQQMQLMQQDLFSEGFKKKQEQQLEASYASATAQLAAQGQANVNAQVEQYEEMLAAGEADLQKSAEKHTAFNKALLEYASLRGVNVNKWYSRVADDRGMHYDELNKRGRADIARLMYDLGSKDVASFREWLSQNYSEEYDFLKTSQSEINKLYGLSSDYRGIGLEKYEAAAQTEEKINEFRDLAERGYEGFKDIDWERPMNYSDEEYLAKIENELAAWSREDMIRQYKAAGKSDEWIAAELAGNRPLKNKKQKSVIVSRI